MTKGARPELAIFFAVLGVLIAVGVPALQREQLVLGWTCLALAAAVAAWGGIVLWRSRN
jgi:hypothetical protein